MENFTRIPGSSRRGSTERAFESNRLASIFLELCRNPGALYDDASLQDVLRLPGTEGSEVGLARSVTFSPDGRWLAAASQDRTVRVWDATNGQQIHKLDGHGLKASCVAFSPAGQLLVSGDWRGTVRIWDAQTGRLLRELTGHKHPVGALAFSPNGGRLAAGWAGRRCGFALCSSAPSGG
jgi:WD40 repeat protein